MKAELKILFYLKKNRLKKNGFCPVMGSITIGKSMSQFSLKTDADARLWDTKAGRMTGKSRSAQEVNHAIDRISLIIHIRYRELSAISPAVDACELKNASQGIASTQATVLDSFRRMNAERLHIYVKAERGTGLAEWVVSTDKLQYDFDKDYYYLLLGVIYPVQDERRDISLVNGMAYINGGQIFGDVIKSINYTDDESNEGSMYDLNNGGIRIGNKLKGLVLDVVNKVFKLFGVTLEFKNADDELVSKIDGNTGAAMFGKGANTFSENGDVSLSGGAHKFNADGSGHLAKGNIDWDTLGNLLVVGKYRSKTDGNRFEIDPENDSMFGYNSYNDEVFRLWYQANLTVMKFVYSTFTTQITATGIETPRLAINYDTISTSDPHQRGTLWRDGNTIRISAG